MYERVIYHKDTQIDVFEKVAASPVGDAILTYRIASLVLCFVFFAASMIVLYKMKTPPAPLLRDDADTDSGERIRKILFVAAAVYAAILFSLRGMIAVDYMDLAYLLEAGFDSVRELLMKRQYFSNLHTPGYMLIAGLASSIPAGTFSALIALNAVFLALTAGPLYRLCREALPSQPAALAAGACLVSPVIVFSFYRTAPYLMIAALYIVSADRFLLFFKKNRKPHLFAAATALFVIPFLHIISSVGHSIFFAGAVLLIIRNRIRIKAAGPALLVLFLAAAGSLLLNFSYFLVFYTEVYDITKNVTDRLRVYYESPGGAAAFVFLCLRIVFNFLASMISMNPWTAAVSALVFMIGAFSLLRRRVAGMLIVILGAGAGSFLLANAMHYNSLSAYPMPYRHLAALSAFFVIVLFAGAWKTGAALLRNSFGGTAACALLFVLFAAGLPGLFNRMRAPEILPALESAYGHSNPYDGVISGNIYFMKDYNVYYFESGRSAFSLTPRYPDAVTGDGVDRSFTAWRILERPDGSKNFNLFTDIAPVHIDSFPTLLKNNFIHRVWYVDNETRRLGVFPDLSGRYEQSIKETLAGYPLIGSKRFRGVELKLYNTVPGPISWGPGGSYRIVAGENDYYFIRGVAPPTGHYSPARSLSGFPEMLMFVPGPVDSVTIRLELEKVDPAAKPALEDLETGRRFRPENDDPARPVFRLDYSPPAGFIHIGFFDFGDSWYKSITVTRQ